VVAGLKSAKHEEFLALVCDLRALGATRVRSGDLEAAFAAPQPEPTSEPERKRDRVSLSTTEMDELEELRALKRRADEMGLEV
jgi:hypothetical protein